MTEQQGVAILVGGCAVADELFKRGHVNDRNMLSASALVHDKNHELVVQAHKAFLAAGATHLVTSNYQIVPGLGFTNEEIREYTRHAGRLAVEARNELGKQQVVTICGSLPPLMPGYRSDRMMDRKLAHEMYLLIGEALWPFVDEYVAETMSSVAEAKVAYQSVHHLNKPVMVSFALNSSGERLRSGEPIVEAISKLLEFTDRLASDNGAIDSVLAGVLFNCSQPEAIAKALKHMQDSVTMQELLRGRSNLRIGGYGDRISPTSTAGMLEERLVAGAMHSALDQEIFSRFGERWVAFGASLVGGCCAVPPAYFAQVVDAVATRP